jgi:hypothetical protein
MADEKQGTLTVANLRDDKRRIIKGQDTKAVHAVFNFLLGDVTALASKFGPPVVASAILSVAVNFLLAVYTVESVREILEQVLPNLQDMKQTLEDEWLANQDFGEPQ